MSYKGSRSRVKDKKSFDDNWDAIFSKKDRKHEKVVEVESGVDTELHGKATRYYYSKKKKKPAETGPAIIMSMKKSSAETKLEG